MYWIVDTAHTPVARLAGLSILCCDEDTVVGFISEDRIYTWMGVRVGYRRGRELVDAGGTVVGRIVEAEDLVVPDTARQLVDEPGPGLRRWWHFLPAPPRHHGHGPSAGQPGPLTAG
jgi:hypothetical protein